MQARDDQGSQGSPQQHEGVDNVDHREDNYNEEGQEYQTGEDGEIFMSAALADQRASKKRAQEDVKLLANRIALLKLEEKKVSESHH